MRLRYLVRPITALIRTTRGAKSYYDEAKNYGTDDNIRLDFVRLPPVPSFVCAQIACVYIVV